MKTKGKLFLQLVTISLGCVAYASGLILFLNPNDLAPGGVSGVSIMLSRFIPVEVGTLILVFNIPLLITAFIKFGAKFTAMTAFATVLSSTIMDLLEAFLPPDYAVTRDKLLAGIFGGTLMALGMGVIFRAGGTTGGSDIIIRLLRRKFRHLKTSTIFLITDCIIVGISALVFGNIEAALYAGIALAVNSSVLDFVLYGSNGARMIFIVTEHPDEINTALTEKLNTGSTVIRGEGAYTGKEKTILMVVAKKHRFPKIRDAVGAADPNSFMIVSSASEIFGNGYLSIFANEL
ncbi:MAG: YitT family protein [Acutalibacteraceae bacterium]|nr:YitT family protein [Clostridia bacterium]MEE1127111.1 YitT family protein [Acutalibacteraceae bacterium]MBQ2319635.1 YitT family protein [Clostridia bacterium]MBQ2419859.1 YitT family protein [Clostridia bacterium]MBQ5598170.1 YitT family protein [Clostridia bacterium]